MARLNLAFLGPFRADLDTVPVKGFESDKVRALLVYLAVQAGEPYRRDSLAALLWPEQPQEVALKNLRHVLYKLRQTLGDSEDEKSEFAPYLLVTTQTAEFNKAGSCELDITEFTQLIEACQTHKHRRVDGCGACHQRLQRANTLYRGDFLAGFSLADSIEFEEWMLVQREALHQQAAYALVNLAAYSEAHGDYQRAASYARKQLEMEPWNEEAHRHLMRLLWLTSQRTAALAQYATCRNVLAEELGIEPGAQTKALYAQILASTSDGPDEQSNIGTVRSRHNLPVQVTPFVGREQELRQIAERLESADRRMVTLLGPGGVGKSRMALKAAENQIGAFEDGVYFVPMAPVASANLIVSTIAQALSLTFSGKEEEESQLLRYLTTKEMLLVMDNFEHILQGASTLLKIIENAPGVSLLVTSREKLNLQAESVVEVSGLSYPDWEYRVEKKALDSDPAGCTPQSALQYEAVRLFRERTQARQRDFEFTPGNLPAVVRICQVVGGLPLAIELAAVQVDDFTCAEIAEAIQANLDFLTTDQRDVSPMHSSIRAVFNYSWDLMSEEEKRVFRGLSVFRGGWNSESAEKVVGASRKLLGTLVSKSLITRSTDDTGIRHDIHEVLRQYAAEQLDEMPGEKERALERHAAFYLVFAEAAEPHLRGTEQDTWLRLLDREHANLQAAIRWAAENGFAETGLRIGGALLQFWVMHAHYATGRALLSSFELQGAERTPAWAKALFSAGKLAMQQGEITSPLQYMEQSTAIYRELGDDKAVRQVITETARAYVRHGNYRRAEELATQGLEMAKTAGDLPVITNALIQLGHAAANQNNYAKARELYTECLSIQRNMNDKWGIAWTLTNLGNVVHLTGDFSTARAMLEESLQIRHELGDKWGIAASTISLGTFAIGEGKYSEARDYLAQSLTLRRELGDAWAIAESYVYYGLLEYKEGKLDHAKEWWRDGVKQSYAQQNHLLLLYALTGLAAAVTTGNVEKAVILDVAVTTLLDTLGVTLSSEFQILFDKVVNIGRNSMREEEWTSLWDKWTKMPLAAIYDVAVTL